MGRRAQKPSGWADYVPLWLVLSGVGVALVLAVLGAVYAPQRAVAMWNYASAEPCPERVAATDCRATLAGRTTQRIDTGGGQSSTPTAVIHVTVPDPPAGTTLFHGAVVVQVSPDEADDLGITGAGQDVTVTLFAGDAVDITGPNGETETVDDPPAVDFVGTFVLLVGCALVTMAGGVYVRSRVRLHGWRSRIPPPGVEPPVPMPRWVRRAMVCVGTGTVAGALLGWLSTLVASDAWLVPVTLGATVATSALLAGYAARRGAQV